MLAALARPHRIKQSHRRRRRIASGALDYNYFRDYEPGMGRYVESDPIGLRGAIDTYAYVRDNPLIYFDPSGLKTVCVPSTKSYSAWFPGKGDVTFTYEGRNCVNIPDPPPTPSPDICANGGCKTCSAKCWDENTFKWPWSFFGGPVIGGTGLVSSYAAGGTTAGAAFTISGACALVGAAVTGWELGTGLRCITVCTLNPTEY